LFAKELADIVVAAVQYFCCCSIFDHKKNGFDHGRKSKICTWVQVEFVLQFFDQKL
jgi:hypothetical protein